MKKIMVLVDFGSTYTKGVAVDLESESIIAQARTFTTINTDISKGMEILMAEMKAQTSLKTIDKVSKLSSSSAAGGLRMVIIGLVPELTVEAGRKAALNAGARVIGSFYGVLNSLDVEQLLSMNPDIILLSGGTDGGNEDVIIENANTLSELPLKAPIIIAGNKNVSHRCREILLNCGHETIITPNVMPNVNKLQIDPAREVIRQVFIDRITGTKGIGKIKKIIPLVMPTPSAVLNGISLIALGTQNESGFGELLAVDVGGATTDVYSVASGAPTIPNIILKSSLPEPYIKRSVEGDLGIRHNAKSILSLVGESRLTLEANLETNMLPAVAQYCKTVKPAHIPNEKFDRSVDFAMTMNSIRLATNRHAGNIKADFIPGVGEVFVQNGKDLRNTRLIIGTGGPIINSDDPKKLLSAATFDPSNPFCLKPVKATIIIDTSYILYAIGLLSAQYPVKALHIAKKYLKYLNECN